MKIYPVISLEERLQKLAPPKHGMLQVVIDSDTKNEVDDQFAIAYALLSSDRLNVQAVYAAPFSSTFFVERLRSEEEALPMTGDVREGMLQSLDESRKLHRLLGIDPNGRTFPGSATYMSDKDKPVESLAARDLVQRAMRCQETLYVLAIGAITNIASAILMEPEIINKIVVVWLAGQPVHWPQALEFNLGQDVMASQVVLDSGVPLVLFPCMSVASNLTTTASELATYIKDKSKIGTFLTETVTNQLNQDMANKWLNLIHLTYNKGLDDYHDGTPCTDTMLAPSRIIWDISVVAYMINSNWCPSSIVPTPILLDNITWAPANLSRHPMRVANFVYRDAIFGDMFAKLNTAP
jgi:purine nucleosidase